MSRKKPSLIIKVSDSRPKDIDSFGDYEYNFFREVRDALAKKGLSIDDIIGKKIGISFKVGCKRKLKSYRFTVFEEIVNCSCCGPITCIY